MKKFLLVTLIGMVLAIDIYGVVNDFIVGEVEPVNHIEETTTTVYME